MSRSIHGRLKRMGNQNPKRKRAASQSCDGDLNQRVETTKKQKKSGQTDSSTTETEGGTQHEGSELSASCDAIDGDYRRFFAEIDSPLFVVCGVCGERVCPKTVHSIRYDSVDPRFISLVATSGAHNDDRGLIPEGISNIQGVDQVNFCGRCYRAISRRQIPPYSAASGYSLGRVPECLKQLNQMEARMIGLGVCFTTCYSLGGYGQSASRGNSVNFWNNVYGIVSKLPRPTNRCGVIHVKKPGSLQGNKYYRVRPWLLREALVWLKAHNPLYAHVTINEDLLQGMPSVAEVDELEIAVDDVDAERSTTRTCAEDSSRSQDPDEHESLSDEEAAGDDEELCEDEEPYLAETFVLGHDGEPEREEDRILRVVNEVQGEKAYILPHNDHLISEYTMKLLMQICFPTLFPNGLGGFHVIEDIEKRVHTFKLAEFCAHLLAWHDRRFITHPSFKFFCLNLIQRRQIDGLMKKIKIRQPSPGVAVEQTEKTAAPEIYTRFKQVKDHLKTLKPFFRCVRGTGLYWANVRDDLMAMLGNPALKHKWPTFFFTLSAADTVWSDFFRACDANLSFSDVPQLSAAARQRYLNENPDIAAHHFHRRFRAFFRHVLCGESRPLGEIIDFFWRSEFQHRGSPQVHGLLWVKDSPDIVELSKTASGRQKLQEFSDKFVSCLRHHCEGDCLAPSSDPLYSRPPSTHDHTASTIDLDQVVHRVQQHTCYAYSSCQRKGKCRFNFPKPLQDSTEIKRTEQGKSVRITFIHRRDNDATNNYNSSLLSAWRANTDIKIVGNSYGVAEYTAAYISKAEPDTVRFLRTIQESLAKLPPGTPIQRLLKRTATTMLGMREVCAQEAVYILSSTLCLYQKSRTVIKVKVSRHDRRYYRVEPRTIVNALLDSEDAEHVRLEQIEAAYMQRPSTADFESLCFREFCERYEISYTSPSERQRLKRWELLGNAGFIKANRTATNAPITQLFLYKPWRQLAEIAVDDEDILREYRSWKDDQESQYISQIVAAKARVEVLEALREERLDNEPLPAPQWSTSLPADTSPLVSTPVAKLTFPSRYQYTADEIDRASSFVRLVIRPFVKERKREDQKPLTRLPYTYPTEQQVPAMTADQWVPFALCMRQNRLRAKAEATQTVCTPIQMIVSGEGGTGKSWLVRQVIEDTKVVFGSDQSRKRILLMAHQGSAAYLIGGGTITSCLGLPGRGSYLQKYEALSGTDKGLTTLRRLQNESEHVHLVVIDEFGVISCGMLHWIDQRLREIFPQTQDQPFGGRDVIFTGDFGQLGPVNPSALSTPDTLLMSEVERAGRTLWTSIQLYCTLNQQNRGIQDPNWYAMLGRVRRGTASPEDVTLINSRMQPSPTPTQTTTHLAYRNVDVDLANKSALRRMDGPICIIDADHTMRFPGRITDEKMSENECKQLINEAKEIKTSNAEFLPLQLSLAIGAPIVLTKNIQQQIGLCNGSRGTVYDIICAPQLKHNQPIVLVRMDNYNGPSFLPEVRSIIPITCETVRLTPKDAPYHLSRTALPLRLAFATTIHKIQGQTCEQVILNPSHINNPALAYVALSRVRRRSDFFLTSPITQQQLQKTDTAKLLSDREDNRLSELSECTRLESTTIVAAMQLLANEHNASLIEG